MKRSHRIGIGLLLTTMIAGAVMIRSTTQEAESSSLSHGPNGWLAARLYLERRGLHVSLLDKPIDQLNRRDVLVLTFPWQRFGTSGQLEAIEKHLLAGGRVIIAYSGQIRSADEIRLCEDLDLDWMKVGGQPPLEPLKWWKFASTEWNVTADPSAHRGANPLLITAPRQVPVPPSSAHVLYRGDDGAPAVFSYTHGHGTVLVLPVVVFSNCRLTNGGNADLLESLSRSLDGTWVFDEYHHGLVSSISPARTASGSFFDYLLLHLVLLYLLTVFAMARRFGPPWKESPVISGSTAAFLMGLGSLHEKLGHHRDAARLLCERAAELDPALEVPAALAKTAGMASRSDFLTIAKAVSELQTKRSKR
jgi:hypothetical protein